MSTKTMAVLLALALSGCGEAIKMTGDASQDPLQDTPDAIDTVLDTGTDSGIDSTDTLVDPGVPCDASTPCPVGFFCELSPGVCDPTVGPGTCTEIPTGGCPEYYAPECGCDGVTYDNACFRQSALVSLAYDGVCMPGDPCAPWLEECDPGEMCEAPPDSCWLEGVTGICTPIRDDCGHLWDPQCGCDGLTYENECARMAAGVWLDHWGECGAPCGAPGSPPCPEGSFCEMPTGMCDAPGMIGECIVVPMGCPDIWDPVCGCDGVTYGNDCDRRAARAQLAHRGEC